MKPGYIPRSIYLCDDTIENNVAFGLLPHEIDRSAVECVCRDAQVHSFIVDELRDKYETVVDERGIKLSGGQRQRLGIARALYCEPHVLVLDEATSAFDGATERQVMPSIANLGHAKTTITIAHRLSTLRDCQQPFLFDKGRIVARGTYDHLVSESPYFRRHTQSKSAELETADALA